MSVTVVHVVASTRADQGGPSRSVPSLCDALAQAGIEVHLITTVPGDEAEDRPLFPGEHVRTHRITVDGLLQSRLRSPRGFWQTLWEVVDRVDPDLLHDHGVWLPSNAVSAYVARKRGLPLIISPRGMLTEWARSYGRWRKKIAWYLYQSWVMKQAHCFHVTSDAEASELRDLGLDQPAAVLPNGVTVPNEVPVVNETGASRALFLSRVHPKKGLPMLLDAWARVRPPGWTLQIAGPDEAGHRAELEGKVEALGLTETVSFPGPVSDGEKWRRYGTAELFVLPSHSENFGIVVPEALAAQVPVITTTATPWQELETEGCGWWVESTTDALAEALSAATSATDAERAAMGRRGRELVEERYQWEAVGKRMARTYDWVTGGASRPGWVVG